MTKTIPYDGSVEAEYADGYIHSETELDDTSPYDSTRNIFNDILEKRPEAEHGKLVRFSLFHSNARYDIDWTTLPDNARPVRFKHMEADSVGGEIAAIRLVSVDFGHQFTAPDGSNQQLIKEIK